MSTVFLRSANSFCEEVSAGTNASTSTPIGKNIASFQGSPDISNVGHRSISPITRNAGKKSAIDTKNKKLKGKASISSIPVKKRKQFSPKMLSKDFSKKLKIITLPDSSVLANKINETLNNTLARESTTTRNMYKQIINSSNDAEESPKLKNSKPQPVKKKPVSKRPDGPIDLKKMFKNNILNNNQAKVKSVDSNVSSETVSGNSRQSLKSFSKRKLYSNVSEFTDNENVNVGEKSFLEKKRMVNIYDPSKKSLEADCGIPQKTSGDKEKGTSTKNINGIKAKAKSSKNYFGETILEKSIIYNTATKTDTHKYVSNLLNGIINKKNLKSSDSQTAEENVENTMEESETESLFSFRNVDSENNANKKLTSKPKPVPIRKIKQKENKNPVTKNKTSKKPANAINQKKGRKSGPEKDSGKKIVAPVKRNTLRQKISDSLKKTNHRSKESINNPVVKKYKSKRETQDDVSNHHVQKNRRLKNYDMHGKRNKENCDFDTISNKFSSKYGPKIIKRSRSNDFQHRDEFSSLVRFNHDNANARLLRGQQKSNQLCLRNDFASCHCPVKSQQIRQLDRYHNTESLPKYSRYEDTQRYYCLPSDFESFYRRYYPDVDNPKKNSMQVALCPTQPSIPRFDPIKSYGIMDAYHNKNFRDETVSLANEFCDEVVKRKPKTYFRQLTETKIIIDNRDNFKLPIGIPKRCKPKAIHNENNFEHIMNDDFSVASEFSSVSRNGYSGRHREELPQSTFSNSSKSVSVVSKRTPLHVSNNSMSHIDNMSSFDNQASNNTQTSNFKINPLRKKIDSFRINSHEDYSKISGIRNDLPKNDINVPSAKSVTNNCYALQRMDSFESLSAVSRVQSVETQLNSPILRKYDQFKKRLKGVTDIDSWRNNFSDLPEPAISNENNSIALYKSVNDYPSFAKTNASTSKTNMSANPKSDDSWITIERPAIPSSPWRSSGSYQ